MYIYIYIYTHTYYMSNRVSSCIFQLSCHVHTRCYHFGSSRFPRSTNAAPYIQTNPSFSQPRQPCLDGRAVRQNHVVPCDRRGSPC